MKEKSEKIEDMFDSIQATRSEIFYLITAEKNFVQFVTNYEDIKRLASIFPEHKKDLFKLVVESNNFNRLTKSIENVSELIDIFPEHKEESYRLVFKPENCTRLITHYIHLRSLTIYFQEYKEELYQWVTQPNNFKRLIDSSNTLKALITDFPEHANNIKDLFMEPQHFMRIVSNAAIRSEFMQRPSIHAYTQGAAIGFFSNRPEGELLMPELAAHIASFLDRKSGGLLAQTRISAATAANIAEEEAKKIEEEDNIPRPQ